MIGDVNRIKDAKARAPFFRSLRGRGQNRYFLVSIDNGVAFARWPDQLSYRSDINDANLKKTVEIMRDREKEGNLEIFNLKDVHYQAESKRNIDDLNAVSAALAKYGAVSLPARLINPRFKMNKQTQFEQNGVSLLSPKQTYRLTPGCCICGEPEGGPKEMPFYSIAGFVESPEAYNALSLMFGGQGVSTEHDISFGNIIATHRFPVNIGACFRHESLIDMIKDDSEDQPQFITKELIELYLLLGNQKEEFSETDMELTDLIQARFGMKSAIKRAEEGHQFGFRFF